MSLLDAEPEWERDDPDEMRELISEDTQAESFRCRFCAFDRFGELIQRCWSCDRDARWAAEDAQDDREHEREQAEVAAYREREQTKCVVCGAVCLDEACPRCERAFAVESRA